MGSRTIQGTLWGKQAKDWAAIQEQTGKAGYDFVLDKIELTSRDRVLDIGCGSGMFCGRVASSGVDDITGIDASDSLIEEATSRYPAIKFLTGEMEELPFPANQFTIVTGFNSFQYAANVKNALAEAKRVLTNDGTLAVMIWGNKEDCEAGSFLKAVGSLLPPPPPGAVGPFALTENHHLENLLEEVGFNITSNTDIDSVWNYPSPEIALKGLMASGPVARAIDHSGFEKTQETISVSMKPFIQAGGDVVYRNKFRIVICQK